MYNYFVSAVCTVALTKYATDITLEIQRYINTIVESEINFMTASAAVIDETIQETEVALKKAFIENIQQYITTPYVHDSGNMYSIPDDIENNVTITIINVNQLTK